MYAIPVLELILAGAGAIGGTTALALLILTCARCEVTRWNIRHAFALARGRAFAETRPTDCGCRKCARHRLRSPPAAPPPGPQPPPWPLRPDGHGELRRALTPVELDGPPATPRPARHDLPPPSPADQQRKPL